MSIDPSPDSPASPSPHLTPEEGRVLGCLIEKSMATPDLYPLTMNSVVAAVNQKSNRDPVVEWDEATVEHALDGLRRKRLAVMISLAGARVPKFKHTLGNVYGGVDDAMLAVLCELLVRNGQTLGELRSRADRLHRFADLASVEATVDRLVQYGMEPLAAILPAGGGRRVNTVVHLLCGDSASPSKPAAALVEAREIPPPEDWKARIEAEIAALRREVDELKALVSSRE